MNATMLNTIVKVAGIDVKNIPDDGSNPLDDYQDEFDDIDDKEWECRSIINIEDGRKLVMDFILSLYGLLIIENVIENTTGIDDKNVLQRIFHYITEQCLETRPLFGPESMAFDWDEAVEASGFTWPTPGEIADTLE